MKRDLFKIFCLMLVVFFSFAPSIAKENDSQDCNRGQLITLIYLNGSNDFSSQNRTKFKEAFERDVAKVHPVMVEYLSKDETIKAQLLENGEYAINPSPVIFYWGNKSLGNVEHIDNGLNIGKIFSPRIAQKVRSIFAHCLHDAIWIQKYQNMTPVIEELHTVIKQETDKGNKVVLLGYSAGSFITYQYFISKFASVNLTELLYSSNDAKLIDIVKYNPKKPTCMDALVESEMVTLKLNGEFDINPNRNTVQKSYNNLDTYTKNVCLCDNSVKGVINFASPFMLFYSEVTDNTSILNHLSQLMFKGIIENNIFFLTVNFRNDPLGYPIEKNVTLQDVKNMHSGLMKDIKPNNGFLYTKSDVYTTNTFISAHMAYWSKPKRFVKGVISAYKDGYRHFYAIEK